MFALGAFLVASGGLTTVLVLVVFYQTVVVHPMAFPDADQLIAIAERHQASANNSGVSKANFQDWRTRRQLIDDMAIYHVNQHVLTAPVGPTSVQVARVSINFCDVLRRRPLHGPGFAGTGSLSNATPGEVLISYALWDTVFGRDQNVVGRRLVLNGDDPYTVVGVMPQGFAFPGADIWAASSVPAQMGLGRRGVRQDRVVARLKPGVSVERGRAELMTLAGQLSGEFPSVNANWTVDVVPLRQAVTHNGERVFVVLAIAGACVTIAILATLAQLGCARGGQRAFRYNIQRVLGATRGRLVWETLAEWGLLAVVSLATSLWLGHAVCSALAALAPREWLNSPELYGRGLAASIGVLLAFVVVVAGALAQLSTAGALGRHTSPIVGEGRVTQHLLGSVTAVMLIAQIAVAGTLLVVAVGCVSRLHELLTTDLGFRTADLTTVRLKAASSAKKPTVAELRASVESALGEAARLPGVHQVAVASTMPFATAEEPVTIRAWDEAGVNGGSEGAATSSAAVTSDINHVSGNYFAVMGIERLAGRTFDTREQVPFVPGDAESARESVVVLGATTASTLWPGQSALGRRVVIKPDTSATRVVVGVVAATRSAYAGASPAQVYVPFHESPPVLFNVIVRGQAGHMPAERTLSDAVARAAVGSIVFDRGAMAGYVARGRAGQSFVAVSVAACTAVLWLVATTCLHGATSFRTSLRLREFAIRAAVGATPRALASNVVAGICGPLAIGGTIALAVSIRVTQQLDRVDLSVPMNLTMGSALVLALSGVGALASARSLSRVWTLDIVDNVKAN